MHDKEILFTFLLSDPSSHLFRCECPDNTTAVGVKYWNRTCVCPGGQFMDLNGDCTYRKYDYLVYHFFRSEQI